MIRVLFFFRFEHGDDDGVRPVFSRNASRVEGGVKSDVCAAVLPLPFRADIEPDGFFVTVGVSVFTSFDSEVKEFVCQD